MKGLAKATQGKLGCGRKGCRDESMGDLIYDKRSGHLFAFCDGHWPRPKGLIGVSLFSIIVIALLGVLLFSSIVFSFTAGTSSLNVTYVLVTTDETNTGIFYRAEQLGTYHLPIKVHYNGTLAPATVTITPSTKSNINWTFQNKLNASDNVDMTDIRVLENRNATKTVEKIDKANQTFSKLANDTLPVGCTENTPTNYTCEVNVLNGTKTITVLESQWISVWSSSYTFNKSRTYYIDFIGTRTVKPGKQAADVVPTFAGFQLPELAWWNSTYARCRNITIGTVQSSGVIHLIELNSSFDYSNTLTRGSDLAFLEGNCTAQNANAAPLNHTVAYWNTSSTSLIFVNVSTNNQGFLAMYYNNTAAPNYSTITATFDKYRREYYDNETVGSAPTSWSAGVTVNGTNTGAYAEFLSKFNNATANDAEGSIVSPTGMGTTGKWGFRILFGAASTAEQNIWVRSQGANTEFVLGTLANGSLFCDGATRFTAQNYNGQTAYYAIINRTTAGTASFYLFGAGIAGALTNCQGIGERTSAMAPTIRLDANAAGAFTHVDDEVEFGNPATITYTISAAETAPDTTAPTITVQYPTNATYATRNMSFGFTTSEALNTCWYILNTPSTNRTIGGCNNATIAIESGWQNLTFYANDTTGNTGNSSTIFVTVYGTAPTVTVDNPVNSTNGTAGTLRMNYTATPQTNLSACWFINSTSSNVSLASCGNTTMVENGEGYKGITVCANTTVGNTTCTNRNWTLDTTAPTVSITNPVNTTNSTTTVLLNFTISETNQPSACWVINSTSNNVSLASCGNTSFTEGANGAKSITVCANDTAGNTGCTNRNWTLDNILPQIVFDSPGNNTITVNDVRLAYRATDTNPPTCVYSTDGGANTSTSSCANVTTIAVADGQHRITLTVNDTANNTNASTINFFINNFQVNFTALQTNDTYARTGADANISVVVLNTTTNATINTVLIQFGGFNRTATAANTSTYWINVTMISTYNESNNSVRAFANISTNATYRANTSLNPGVIYDATAPSATITRWSDFNGLLRGSQFRVNASFADTWANNWSLIFFNTSTAQFAAFNGTVNSTFLYNSSTTADVGNWSVNLTAYDLAENNATATTWMGIASVAVTADQGYEAVNFTTAVTAWGNGTSLANNTREDFMIDKMIRMTWAGICASCTATAQFNTSTNITGNYTQIQLTNSTNATISLASSGGNQWNFTGETTSPNMSTNFTQDYRLRFNVPASLIFTQYPDTGNVTWYIVRIRNISGDAHPRFYARTQLATNHVFDSATSHLRYNWCLSGVNATAAPPTCSTLDTAVDVVDTNNSNNGVVNANISGPTSARNVLQFYGNFSDALIRATVQGGGMVGSPEGAGAGGFLAPATVVANATTTCPPGFHLQFSEQFQKDVCESDKPTLDIGSSRVAMITLIIIVGGVAFLASTESKRKKRDRQKKRQALYEY